MGDDTEWHGYRFVASKVDPHLPNGILNVHWLAIKKTASAAKDAVQDRVGHDWQVKLLSEGQSVLHEARARGLSNDDLSDV